MHEFILTILYSELMHPLSVHPLSIGIHNCNKSRTAGVKCQRIISPSRSTAQSTRCSYHIYLCANVNDMHEFILNILYSVLMISTSLKQGYNNSRSTASDDSVFLMVSIIIIISMQAKATGSLMNG